MRFVNLLLKLIFFVRLEQLLQDLTGMFGERLVGTDLVAAESVVENIDSLARLVQNVASRQVEVKGTCFITVNVKFIKLTYCYLVVVFILTYVLVSHSEGMEACSGTTHQTEAVKYYLLCIVSVWFLLTF